MKQYKALITKRRFGKEVSEWQYMDAPDFDTAWNCFQYLGRMYGWKISEIQEDKPFNTIGDALNKLNL